MTAGPAPGPPRGDVRNLRLWSRDPLSAISETSRRYGDVVRLSFGFGSRRQVVHLVRRPDDIAHVLLTNQANYRRAFTYETLEALLGKGLLTNEGEPWARQRRLVQPIFSRRNVVGFAPAMAEATADHLTSLDRRIAGDAGLSVDVAAQMSALTLDIVGRTLFGARLADEAAAVGPALTTVLRAAVVRIRHPLPRLVPGGERLLWREQRRFDTAAATLDDIVRGLVARHIPKDETSRQTLLDLLLAARDEETGEAMSPTQVRDELMTFLLAGHETTANALAWTLCLLSRYPEARDRLEDEVDAALSGRQPTADDEDKLPWTRAVIDESMRLYPPAWMIERDAIDDDEVGGYAIPAGSTVMTPPLLVHHDPREWPDPEGFDPRRFLPGAAEADRHRFGYLPFGGGRRQCVGSGFATLEATVVLAMLAQRFSFELDPGWPVVPEPTVTLRPRYGIRMTVRRR